MSTNRIDIKKWTTFGVSAKVDQVIELNTIAAIYDELSRVDSRDFLVLGGGSNMLFVDDIEMPVFKVNLKGIDIVQQDDNHIWLQVSAGENWHEFVLHCVNNNWGGVENLSLIPGSVGAAPIQNIGAYGVEVKDVITAVGYIDLNDKQEKVLSNKDCQFDYRNSIFKNELKGQFIITHVVFKLSKKPQIHINYGNIQQVLSTSNKKEYTIKDVSDAVISIRKSKLPDPEIVGNAGSFFKNPIIAQKTFNALAEKYKDIPHYIQNNGIKIPAAWLIQECGWKGYRKGDYGVHPNQALVLVNYGDAKGRDIYNLSASIISSVKDKFSISLEREVQMIGLI